MNKSYLEGGGTLATSFTMAAVKVFVAQVMAWAIAVPPIPIIAAWNHRATHYEKVVFNEHLSKHIIWLFN